VTPLRDVASWVCWSPRRARYVGLAVAVTLGVLLIFNVSQQVGRATAARPKPAVTATPTPSVTTDPARDPAALAVRFVDRGLARSTTDAETWKVQLAGMATPELAEGLLSAPSDAGPAGRATGPAELLAGDVYKVPTTAGVHVVRLEATPTGYAVSDFITGR
jgi:hypothetical protein